MTRLRTSLGLGLGLALALTLAGCRDAPAARDGSDRPASATTGVSQQHRMHQDEARPTSRTPLRAGERLQRLAMPAAYTPSAPYGTGTDDYRCFVLDPHLARDAFITGMDIAPGTPDEVHHVILFRAPPATVPAVEAKDAAEPGQGWTCFGDTGIDPSQGSLDDAPWLGAWAPGGTEQVSERGVGVPLAKGSRIIMQVHYNLLAGPRPDVSSAVLRLAPGTQRLAALHTMLLPAPVELPCRPGHTGGPLCERDASVDDAVRRFGGVGRVADYLHLLCGPVRAGPTQSCTRTVTRPATVRAAAGHMHLMGRSVSVTVNPGTPRARTLLDIPRWDFDDQAARPVHPVRLRTGDRVRVTCRHDQRLHDLLPAFDGQPEKYVVWGEGTTDEMCLGLLLVTRP